jgi:LysM repeat protein
VKVHRVRRGDTVSEISNRYGVPQRVIISYNKLNRRGFLRVGQRLIIPVCFHEKELTPAQSGSARFPAIRRCPCRLPCPSSAGPPHKTESPGNPL